MNKAPVFSIKSLFNDTIVYGLARFISAFLSIFLIPIYTRYFTVAEYGIIENLNILGVLVINIFGLSLSEGLFRYYTLSDSDLEKKKLLSTAHYISIASGFLALITGLLIHNWFGEIFIQKSEKQNFLLILLAIIHAMFSINLTVYQSILRIKFNRLAYNITTIGVVLLTALFSIFFVIVMNYGILSVFLAAVIANAIFVLYGYIKVKNEISLKYFSFISLKNLLPYCYPLIIASLAILIMRSSDRYFITLMLPDSLLQVGLYTTAEKIMTPLLLITAAFHTAFVPFILSAAKTQDIKPLLIKIYKLYISATTIFVIFFSMISKYLLMILTTEGYYQAYQYTYLVGVYLILNVSYYFGGIGLSLKEKTKYVGIFVLIASLINIILNVILIPKYSVTGALWATVISYFTLNVLIFYKSNSYFEVNFPFLNSGIVIIFCTIISFFSLDNFFIGIFLMIALIIILFWSGFISKKYFYILGLLIKTDK